MKTILTFLLCGLAFGCSFDNDGVPGGTEVDAAPVVADARDVTIDVVHVDAMPADAMQPTGDVFSPVPWDGVHNVLWTYLDGDCPPGVPFLRNQWFAKITNSTTASGTIVFQGPNSTDAIITTLVLESPYAAKIGQLAYGSIGIGDAFTVVQIDSDRWHGVEHVRINGPDGTCDAYFLLEGTVQE